MTGPMGGTSRWVPKKKGEKKKRGAIGPRAIRLAGCLRMPHQQSRLGSCARRYWQLRQRPRLAARRRLFQWTFVVAGEKPRPQLTRLCSKDTAGAASRNGSC